MHPLIRLLQQKLIKKIPEIKAGYTVRVSQKVKEGDKERIQNFEGLVIKVGHGEGPEKTFTVRKIVEGIGVEKIFPMHSPNITKILVIKKAKVRRSKLYYMRERFGKSARLTERHVTDEERAAEDAKMEEYIQEAIKAEEKRKKEQEQKVSADNIKEENTSKEPIIQTEEPAVEEAISETGKDLKEELKEKLIETDEKIVEHAEHELKKAKEKSEEDKK